MTEETGNDELMELLDKELGEAASEEDIEAAEAEQTAVEDAEEPPKEEPETEQTEEDETAAKEPEEKEDEVNAEETDETDDDLRKHLKPRTQKRFDELIGQSDELKTLKPEYEQLKGQYDSLSQTLQSTGGTAEEIGEALDYVAMVKAGNMGAMKAHLDRQIANYQQTTGQKYAAPDPFANHPELRNRVDNLDTTEEDALERVRLQNMATQLETQQRTQLQAQQQKQRQDTGYQAMQQMETTVINANRAAFTPDVANYIKGKIQEDMQVYPPEQWANRYQAHYNDIIKFAQPAPVPAPAQPEAMRSTPTSSAPRAPKTMEDAMLNAIAEANA